MIRASILDDNNDPVLSGLFEDGTTVFNFVGVESRRIANMILHIEVEGYFVRLDSKCSMSLEPGSTIALTIPPGNLPKRIPTELFGPVPDKQTAIDGLNRIRDEIREIKEEASRS